MRSCNSVVRSFDRSKEAYRSVSVALVFRQSVATFTVLRRLSLDWIQFSHYDLGTFLRCYPCRVCLAGCKIRMYTSDFACPLCRLLNKVVHSSVGYLRQQYDSPSSSLNEYIGRDNIDVTTSDSSEDKEKGSISKDSRTVHACLAARIVSNYPTTIYRPTHRN